MLLGRHQERRQLERLLATARSGSSAVLALVGEPGIGKTALLEAAAEQAASMRVLRVRGIQSEARIPFAALLELLRPTLALLERIPAPQAAALEVALAVRPGTGGDRFSIGAGTLSLLAAYAEESPTLVLIDDAHWLDAATAEALLFAVRRLLAEPICVLIAARGEERSLLDGSDLPSITLAGLEREAAESLLGPLPESLVERIQGVTGGNPLALIELARDTSGLTAEPSSLPLPLPEAIARAFSRRADGLDEQARRLLVLLAAAGDGELAALERAASSLAIELESIAAAESAGLVRLADGRAEFNHPLARSAIYASAEARERRAAHRALAAALPDRDLDRRAWHLALSCVGSNAAAAAALAQAGARASARSGFVEASAAFERAAALTEADTPRSHLLLDAAEAAWSAGFGERALGLLDSAAALDPDGWPEVRVERLRGRIAARRGPVMVGHALLVRAAERAAETDLELAVTIFAEAVDACFYAGDAREMRRTAERIEALLHDASSLSARFVASVARGMALVMCGEGESGIAAIREGVALAEGAHGLGEEPHLLPWLVAGPMWLRELEAGAGLIALAIEHAREHVSLDVLPWLLERVARSHAATDHWSQAEVEYDEAIRLAGETGQRAELAATLAGLACLEARLGREHECRAHAAESGAICGELGMGLYEAWTLRALGELELGLGRAAEATEHLERLEQHLERLGIGDVDLSPGPELVDAYLRVGRLEDARIAAARLESRAREKGQPWSLARAERCLGMLAESDYERHFADALRLHELTPDLFEQASTQLAFGARLRRDRRRVLAREQLRAAVEVFARLGAVKLYERAEAELRATGESSRRRDPSTLDQLTPQELHIARLLASGRTTREAAASLFLSPKTIEYHLRSVYRKLGVKSREDLRAAVAGTEP